MRQPSASTVRGSILVFFAAALAAPSLAAALTTWVSTATKALPPDTLAEHDAEMHALRRYAEG